MLDERIQQKETLEFILTPSEVKTAIHHWILENSTMIKESDVCQIEFDPGPEGTITKVAIVVIKA